MAGLVTITASKELEIVEVATTADLASRWIQSLHVKPASVKAYEKGLKRLREYFSARGITNPTRADIINYYDFLGAKYSARTANLYIVSCRRFFAFLYNEGIISKNVAADIKGFKTGLEHAHNPLTPNAAKKIISDFDTSTLLGLRDKCMFELMISSGLRCCEIARANVEDLDDGGENVILFVQGKGRDTREEFVPVPENVVCLIREYLLKRGCSDGKAPLFASLSNNHKGGRLAIGSISRIMKTAMRAAGYDNPRLVAHSLRTSAATAAIKSGADILQVQNLLRHRSPSVTMVYIAEINKRENPASQMAAGYFGI